jgi:hypothetical protein
MFSSLFPILHKSGRLTYTPEPCHIRSIAALNEKMDFMIQGKLRNG